MLSVFPFAGLNFCNPTSYKMYKMIWNVSCVLAHADLVL